MADELIVVGALGNSIRLKDMGDGSFAEVIAVAGAVPSIVGTVNGVASWVRPANTTAYAALDAINDAGGTHVIVFTGAARVTGGTGYVTKVRLSTDLITSMTARFRLHLFNAAPTAIADNSPYLALYANVVAKVGTLDLPAMVTEDPTNSTMSSTQNINDRLPFKCAADANLYGILETLDAFTPASGQHFYIEISADQN